MKIDNKGLTLIEILIAVVILAVALVPFVGIFTGGVTGGSSAQQITVGTTLAQDLMEEILSKSFDETLSNPTPPGDLGPEQNENRSFSPPNDFDDVDDYNGYVDEPPEEVDGTPMAAQYDDFSRSVTVEYVTEDDFNIVATEETPFKRITVIVSWEAGQQSVTLVTVPANYTRD
ncbi:MAG: prepilin-type N-terminal cleavage/methylation domain-containing protein [bacterium]